MTDLAEEVGVHPSHLARELRRTYGVSVGELVRRRRIEYALERLRSNDASLAEIAVDCGFTDQSHLTRSFRRVVGSTPGEYRRRIGTNRRAESPAS